MGKNIEGMLNIDRSKPFSPAKFPGEGRSIWRGPVDGDGVSGEEDQDKRSLALTEIYLPKIRLVSCLKKDEGCISGEETINRLKVANYIRLDAKVFQALLENKCCIPKHLKVERPIFFDGTPFCSSYGLRYVLYFCWVGGDEWRWVYFWLDRGRGAHCLSAVLEV